MSIERRAISALKWATAARLIVQIVSWAGTLVVVRLLSPEDYGLMAKVAVVCGVTSVIAELGLEAAIVRSPEIGPKDLRKIFGISLLFAGGLTIALMAAAPLFALLFREPRLTWPIAVASLQIFVGAVAVIPSALANRDLLFRRLSQIEIVSGITTVVVTLVFALLHAGVWALVLGTLCGATARSAALLKWGERVWPLVSLQGIGEHIKFGLTVVGNRVSYSVVVQSDVLIGSAFLSTTEIGQYAVALQLATLPMNKVMGTINQITLPAVARQQHNLPRVRESLLKAVGVMSLLAFPMLWGISAVAPELVQTMFGSAWSQAIPALMILPLVAPIRMISSVMFTTSLALGNRNLDVRNTIIYSVMLPAGFFVGAHWGLVGLCTSWLVSVPISYCFSIPTLMRLLRIPVWAIVWECGAPAVAAGVMYLAVWLFRSVLVGQGPFVMLFTLSAFGALVYFAVIALISPRHLVAARGFARSLLQKDSPPPAPAPQ